MATTQLPQTSHFRVLKEGLLIPVSNPGLFAPIWALTIAEAALHINPALVAVPSVIISMTVGSIVAAVTTSAAVVTHATDNISPSFGKILGADALRTALFHSMVAAFSSLVLPIYNLIWSARSPLVLVVVLVAAGLAQMWLSNIVLPVAIVVVVSEPRCHRIAALERALSVTAENTHEAAVLVLLTGVVISVDSPRHGSSATGYPSVAWLGVVMSGTLRLYSLCIVTAFYHECKSRLQTSLVPGEERPIRCLVDGLKEMLQGRRPVRHVLTAMVDCLRTWIFGVMFLVSNNPWVASVVVICAARLISEGPPSVFYQDGAVRGRNYLKQKYKIHPGTGQSMA